MAIWPTNQANYQRTGQAAFATRITPEDWTFDLSVFDVDMGGGSQTWSWTWTHDPPDEFAGPKSENWFQTQGASVIQGVWFRGSDGSPAPGCITGNVSSAQDGVAAVYTGVGLAWGMCRTATNANLSLRIKNDPIIPPSPGMDIEFCLGTGAGAYVILTIPAFDTVDDWTAFSGSVAIPAPYGNPEHLKTLFARTVIPFTEAPFYLDTVSITLDYDNIASHEVFLTGPVVSDSGYIWAGTTDECNRVFLLCLNSDGSLKSHTRVLNWDGGDILQRLSTISITTDTSDNAYLVVDDSVVSYDVDGNLRWRHGNLLTYFPPWPGSCIADDGFLYVANTISEPGDMEALSLADGSVDHSWNMGLFTTNPGGFSVSGDYAYLPLWDAGVTNAAVLVKAALDDGTVAWTKNLSTVGAGWERDIYVPSVANGHAYAIVSTDNDTGNLGLFSFADADGTVEWIYSVFELDVPQIPYDAPAVDGSGRVYAPLFSDVLAAVDPTDGSELWRYTDGAETGDDTLPSIGNDGTLLLSRTNLVRLNIADGSVDSKTATLVSPFPAALSTNFTYVTEGKILHAFGAGGGGDITEPRAWAYGEARAAVFDMAGGMPMPVRSRALGRARTVVYNAQAPVVPPGTVPFGAGFLYYWTVADTPLDRDAPNTVKSRIVTRPYDQSPTVRAKRASMLAVYGTTAARKGQEIGTVAWFSEGRLIGRFPVRAWVTLRGVGALFEVCPPPVKTEVGWAELDFTLNDIAVEDIIWEFSALN